MNYILNILLQPSHLVVFAVIGFLFFFAIGKMSRRS